MVNWEAAATRVYCDAVDDDVTILVYKDRSTRCTGSRKYVESLNKETAKMLKSKAKRLGRNLRRDGPRDCRTTDYRDILVAQDKAIPRQRDESNRDEHGSGQETVIGGN